MNKEHDIQVACVTWFKLAYPKYNGLLFAIPNGGKRNIITAKKLKSEGVVSGVSDLILLIHKGQYNSLCIEMKTKKGKQSENQIAWQKLVENYKNKYVVCHSFDDFRKEIYEYLLVDNTKNISEKHDTDLDNQMANQMDNQMDNNFTDMQFLNNF